MAASALPQTLKSITATKIRELNRQRDNFEAAKQEIYIDADGLDQVDATEELLKGTCKLKNVRLLNDDSTDDDEFQSTGPLAQKLRNQSLLLRQARADPTVKGTLSYEIGKALEQDLEMETVRHQHAQFFSKLVTEWLSNPEEEKTPSSDTQFEEVGRKEMHEQRATWESLVFASAKVNTSRLETYLEQLFTANKSASTAYEDIVKRTKAFGSELLERREFFTPDSLKDTMAGLARTDLLSEEKTASLQTFRSNKEVLKEIADVLNMRYVTLSTWQWTTTDHGIPVEMRRQLNGKYRVFMDEDVLDALLVYEIGLKWSVHFNNVFRSMFNSLAWKRSEKVIPKRDRERREFYLPSENSATRDSVQQIRRDNYSQDYFLTQLPLNEAQGKRNYDEDNDDDEVVAKGKGPLELKHGLLHMLVAEALVAKSVRPDTVHTVVRSDFKWFGPGLPHETIYVVLKFFGVGDTWLEFFRKFLEVPLCFVHDGPDAAAQTRKRGVPMSHTLSDVFGEAVLFVMDYAVNQATSTYLYRLHDDFWLWGSEDTCLKGWKAMTKFANIVGIEFNQEKTGTVRFGAPSAKDTSDSEMSEDEDAAYSIDTTILPPGDVRWGFLRLDAESARFLVDQAQVDEHIKELDLQLSYCKSIFSYVQAYNAYVGRFFSNNFGKPSYAFGREHVDMMIKTFARIQKEIYGNKSASKYLASLASARFDMKNLPEGFWYFPVQQGGLELRNPLIPLLGMRETLRRSPQRMLEKSYDKDVQQYLYAEQNFKDHGGFTGFGKSHNAKLVQEIHDSGETFMPLDEYLRYREERSNHLATVYRRLLVVPEEQQIQETAELASILTQGSSDLPSRGKSALLSNFNSMNPYWKWMVALYGKDIVDHYGSVRMVDGSQVPLGVVSLMKKGRVRWRG